MTGDDGDGGELPSVDHVLYNEGSMIKILGFQSTKIIGPHWLVGGVVFI